MIVSAINDKFEECQLLLYCFLFSTSKNKESKLISKSITNAMLAMKFLWTSKFIFL